MRFKLIRIFLVLCAIFGDEPLHAEGLTEALRTSPLSMAPQVTVPVVLELKKEVELSGDRLQLGQIASCSGAFDRCDEIYAIDLGEAPEAGKTRYLHRRKIAEILVAEWPDAELRFEGSDSVRVTASFVEISDEDVLTALRQAIVRILGERTDLELVVERLQGGGAHRLRPGHYRMVFPFLEDVDEIHIDQLLQCCSGPRHIDVVFVSEPERGAASDEAAIALRAGYTVHFALKRLLLVAKSRMRRGETIGKNDLERRLVDISRSRHRYPDAAGKSDGEWLGELVGRRLKRNVEAWAPIALDQTEALMTIHKGQIVRLNVQRGGLAVTSRVKALAAGGHGQIIDVMHPTTKRRLRARIIDSQTVEFVR